MCCVCGGGFRSDPADSTNNYDYGSGYSDYGDYSDYGSSSDYGSYGDSSTCEGYGSCDYSDDSCRGFANNVYDPCDEYGKGFYMGWNKGEQYGCDDYGQNLGTPGTNDCNYGE